MAYTHTFQIEVNSVDIDGELSFNGGKPQIKIMSPVEVPIGELDALNEFIKSLHRLYDRCNEHIGKIEITEKP